MITVQLKQFQSQLLLHKIGPKQKLSSWNKGLFQKSNIIKTQEQKQTMLNLLNKKVENVQLLYKASEHQFKLDNFYKKCTYIPNTLVLIQTKFGKKVGGFTPLCWKEVQVLQRVVDLSNSSFIFSLSNKQKLMQKSRNDSGIWYYQSYGPIFGAKSLSSCGIVVVNQANKNEQSAIGFGFGYSNEKYNQISKLAFQCFSGNPYNSHSTSLSQWQVWSVIFQQ